MDGLDGMVFNRDRNREHCIMTLDSTSLAGRRALVTGAQQGIGKAAVLALAAAGADVAINWLDDKEAAQATSDDIAALGRRALLVQGSVARKP